MPDEKQTTPDEVWLTPTGGLPSGVWPRAELVRYVRAGHEKAVTPKMIEAAKDAIRSACDHDAGEILYLIDDDSVFARIYENMERARGERS